MPIQKQEVLNFPIVVIASESLLAIAITMLRAIFTIAKTIQIHPNLEQTFDNAA